MEGLKKRYQERVIRRAAKLHNVGPARRSIIDHGKLNRLLAGEDVVLDSPYWRLWRQVLDEHRGRPAHDAEQ